MAPRGRRRRVGLKRMDAAIDALIPMGFSPDLIRQKVRNLLQVYGGDEAWPVIEEGYYKLLIESILEDQEQEQIVQEPEKVLGQEQIVREEGHIVEQDSPSDTPAQGGVVAEPSEAEPLLSPNTVLELLRPGFEHFTRRASTTRKPCLGWIGPKDDSDFVLLRPYPVQHSERRRKCKSRWDEKPDVAV